MKKELLKKIEKVFSISASFGLTLGCFVGSLVCIKSTIKNEEKASKIVEIVQPYEETTEFKTFENKYIEELYKAHDEGLLTKKELEKELKKTDACLVEYGVNNNIISISEKENYYKSANVADKTKRGSISLLLGEVVGDVLFLTAWNKYEKKEEEFEKN